MDGYRVVLGYGTGETLVRRSRFIGEIYAARSLEEARASIESVKKTHFDARHHCFALRIGSPGRAVERSSDDGEPSATAGAPLLGVLRGFDLYDACLVVTRYFGGTLLGTGPLSRAYREAGELAAGGADCALVRSGSLYGVTLDYSYLDLFRREAAAMGLVPYDESYSEVADLEFIVGEDTVPAFCAMASRVSLGGSVPRLLRSVVYFLTPAGIPRIYA